MRKEKPLKICSILETADFIRRHQASLVRFGEGEVALMHGYSIPYQSYDEELAQQLLTVMRLQSSTSFLVGLPDIFNGLSHYTPAAQDFWRIHYQMYQGFYGSMCQGECYATSFLSRPYMDLSDKRGALSSFEAIKSIWQGRSVLIVEGETSLSGVGNDLFQGAESVSRIICPSHEAYAHYARILKAVKRYGKGQLILLMLGPTAKVLAYDLALAGYQAVDLGHIDSEYEWFQMKAQTKIKLKHKHTAEYNHDEGLVLARDSAYQESILTTILDAPNERGQQHETP